MLDDTAIADVTWESFHSPRCRHSICLLGMSHQLELLEVQPDVLYQNLEKIGSMRRMISDPMVTTLRPPCGQL